MFPLVKRFSLKGRMRFITLTLLFLCLLDSYRAVQAQGEVIYVNDNATGDNNGSSWTDAFTKLQDALAAAVAGDQIWVAGGVYYPDEGTGKLNNSTSNTFQLKNGVALYGGFGGNETNLSQRNFDPNINATVLSGDITQNDETDASKIVTHYTGIITPNAINVVTAASVGATTILDGFVLTGGRALSDNALCANGACGGGLYATNSSLTLANLTVIGNTAYYGAGMIFLGFSTPTLTDMRFESNLARGLGGGLDAQDNAVPALTRVTFDGNYSEELGGGAYFNGINPTLQDVHFIENIAENGGGIYLLNASPTLDNVTFTENRAQFYAGGQFDDFHGGGVYNKGGSPILRNVTFTKNESKDFGGGMYNESGSARLENVTFTKNRAGTTGGGMRNAASSLTLLNVTFTHNSAAEYGGGIDNLRGGHFLHNVRFFGNVAAFGGGMYNADANVFVINSIFSGNRATSGGGGGGISDSANTLHVVNSSFSGNVSPGSGSGIDSQPGGFSGELTLDNVLMWGNSTLALSISDTNITSILRNNLIEGMNAGNTNLDGTDAANAPLFVRAVNCGGDGCGDVVGGGDEATNDDYGDLRLQGGSPTIDAGDNALLPTDMRDVDQDSNVAEQLPIDAESVPRVAAVTLATAVVDIGAHERQNTAPIAHAGGPYTTPEGGTIALNASDSTDDGGIATYAWDCTNNGSTDASAATPTGNTCAYPDNGSFTMRLTVTDNPGATHSTTTQVNVANVAPILTPSANQSTLSGSAKLFNIGSFTDPGAEGTWPVTIDWGDDTTSTEIAATAAGTLPTASHTYAAPGAFNVLVTISDGESTDDAGFQVQVNAPPPGAPAVTPPANQNGDEGIEQSFILGEFTDEGSSGPWQVTIVWGDNSANTVFSVTSSGAITAKPHTYTSAGTFDVLVTVSDGTLQSSIIFRVTITGEDEEVDSNLYLPTTRKP